MNVKNMLFAIVQKLRQQSETLDRYQLYTPCSAGHPLLSAWGHPVDSIRKVK